MFGLFKNRKNPSVTPEDKAWIEQSLTWFVQAFGHQGLTERPFILPTADNFPYNDLRKEDQFQRLFEQLCKHWDLDSDDIIVRIFDDFQSKEWTVYQPHSTFNEPTGLYHRTEEPGKKRFTIQLARSNQGNPQLMIAVMAHELAHVKLLGGNFLNKNAGDMEPLTDLACIYFGFGLFVANTCEIKNAMWLGRNGYLPNEVISYANALLCYLSGKSARDYEPYLNTNTRAIFLQDYDFLKSTNETTLNREMLVQNEHIYQLYQELNQQFKDREFENIIDNCHRILEINPQDNAAFNNIGYALLQMKRYPEAIDAFTQAISIDPYWDYAYNNRGYCKLQLKDYENAYGDLHTSFEMNPDNSFSWRNMGAYYLRFNEGEKALHHLQEAEKLDPKTEMINFYLAQAYRCLGDTGKATHYLNRSRELDEHNDSMVE